MSARTEAIAFRIWAYCEPREWDCTLREIADALEVDLASVRSICRHKGWSLRLRKTSTMPQNTRIDGIDGGSYRQIIRELTT